MNGLLGRCLGVVALLLVTLVASTSLAQCYAQRFVSTGYYRTYQPVYVQPVQPLLYAVGVDSQVEAIVEQKIRQREAAKLQWEQQKIAQQAYQQPQQQQQYQQPQQGNWQQPTPGQQVQQQTTGYLQQYCAKCHTGENARGGVILDSRGPLISTDGVWSNADSDIFATIDDWLAGNSLEDLPGQMAFVKDLPKEARAGIHSELLALRRKFRQAGASSPPPNPSLDEGVLR